MALVLPVPTWAGPTTVTCSATIDHNPACLLPSWMEAAQQAGQWKLFGILNQRRWCACAHHEETFCGFEGLVDAETHRHHLEWTCPRCGTDHSEELD